MAILAAAFGGLLAGLAIGYRCGRARVQTTLVFPSVKEAPIVYRAERLELDSIGHKAGGG